MRVFGVLGDEPLGPLGVQRIGLRLRGLEKRSVRRFVDPVAARNRDGPIVVVEVMLDAANVHFPDNPA
mgnify:CR=1 FL=1